MSQPRKIKTEAVQGRGSWVKVTSPRVREIRRYVTEGEGFDASLDLIAVHIVEWNWVDEENCPLPLPSQDANVLEDMTQEEVEFLVSIISGVGIVSRELEVKIAKYLWLGTGNSPWELLEMRLCRDVYQCLPSQLADEDWFDIVTHLRLMGLERRARR